jgi:PAS domain S-box-containing protein
MSEHTKPIRILHVDDDPDLAELVAVYLQREDDRFEIESARNASDGLDRLHEAEFDCIVSDHDMPGKNGIEFLETVRNEYPDIPFILFTGKGSEEVASDAISVGVSDYLQKGSGTDRYVVLANRIQNVITKRRAEQEAEQIRTRLEAITTNSNDAIFTINSDRTIRFVNQAAGEMFGYEPDSLIGEPLKMLLPARYHTNHSDVLKQFLEPGEESLDWTATEFTVQHRDGHEIPVSVSLSEFQEDGDRQFVGVFRDISNRVRMEEELREREQRFRQMAENIQEMVWMTDPRSGDVLYVNHAYNDIWGRQPDGLYQNPQSFLDAIHPDDRDRVGKILDPQSPGSYEEEYRIIRPDGEVRWVYDRAVPIKDDAGEIYRTVGIASDITDRKEREQKYNRVLELLDHTERIADVGGWEIDPETREVFWSNNLFELLGWEDDEEPGLEDALNVYVEADRPRVENAVETALTTGNSFAVEARFQLPNGDIRWAEIRGEPHVKAGEVVSLRGAVHDITSRKRREHVLRELYEITSNREKSFEEKIQALLELGRRELGTEYGTLSKIRGDEYVFEFVDTDDDSIQSGDVVPLSATNCELVASTEQTVVLGDIEREAPDETDRTGFTEWGISCYIGAPVFVENGVYGTFCFYDTEAKTDQFSEFEETLVDLMSMWVSGELQQQYTHDQLRKQNEQLNQFAGVVSHDLRNPLNVAEGRLRMARDEYESEHLETVSHALDRMNALIDDLLLLSRAGEQIGELEEVDLTDLTRDCWENVATADATLTADITRKIHADRSRLKQLLENLFRNAIAHGGEDVSISIGELDDGFYVEDTGSGIPEDDHQAVFEAGYSTAKEGTGFGLTIVTQVAQAHGWSVRVTDGSGGGARFEITGIEFCTE